MVKSEDHKDGPAFKSPINLNDLHLLNNKKGIRCPKCSAHFFFKEYFKQHLQDDHFMCTVSEIQEVIAEALLSEDVISSSAKIDQSDGIPDTTTKISFICNYGIDGSDTKAKKPFKCEESLHTTCSPAKNLAAHPFKRSVRPNESIKCDKGSYSAALESCHTVHQRTHTGEKPFKCDKCSYSAARKFTLFDHQRTHTGEKSFKCNEGSYSAAKKSSLTVHQRTHTGEKPFKCNECSYSASRRLRLTRHQRTHTGERYFKCDVCSYSAARKFTLFDHQRTHTGEKPFKCNECSYSTSRKSSLTVHDQRKHTGKRFFKCDKCPYSTAKKSSLTIHQFTHRVQVERYVKCQKFSFALKSQRTNTVKKHFKYDECSSSAKKLNLAVHCKRTY